MTNLSVEEIADLAEVFSALIGEEPIEKLAVSFFDRHGMFLMTQIVAEGDEAKVSASMKATFENGWKRGARFCISSHNHPNGYLKPSQADVKTQRLERVFGGKVDVRVVDHIIVGPRAKRNREYFSFQQEGLI